MPQLSNDPIFNKLYKRCSELEASKRTSEEEKKALEAKNSLLEAQIKAFTEQINDLRSNNEMLAAERTIGENARLDAEEHAKKVERSLQELKKESITKNSALEKENQSLKAQVSILEKEREHLLKKNAESERRLLEAQKSAYEAPKSALEAENRALRAQIVDVRKRNIALATKLEMAQSARHDAEDRIEDLEIVFQEFKQDKEAETAEYEKENQSLKGQILDLEEELDRTRDENIALQEELANLEERYNEDVTTPSPARWQAWRYESLVKTHESPKSPSTHISDTNTKKRKFVKEATTPSKQCIWINPKQQPEAPLTSILTAADEDYTNVQTPGPSKKLCSRGHSSPLTSAKRMASKLQRSEYPHASPYSASRLSTSVSAHTPEDPESPWFVRKRGDIGGIQPTILFPCAKPTAVVTQQTEITTPAKF